MHIAHVTGDGDKTMGNVTGTVRGGGPRATLQNNRKRFYFKHHAICVLHNAPEQ